MFTFLFHQVERQKLKTEEGSMRLSAEKSRLDRSLNTTEQELQEAQQQILMLQVMKPTLTESSEIIPAFIAAYRTVRNEGRNLLEALPNCC